MFYFLMIKAKLKSFQKIKIRLNKSPNNITFLNNEHAIKIKNV